MSAECMAQVHNPRALLVASDAYRGICVGARDLLGFGVFSVAHAFAFEVSTAGRVLSLLLLF